MRVTVLGTVMVLLLGGANAVQAGGAPPSAQAQRILSELTEVARSQSGAAPGWQEMRYTADRGCDVLDVPAQQVGCFEQGDIGSVAFDYSPHFFVAEISIRAATGRVDPSVDPSWEGLTTLVIDVETTGDDVIDFTTLLYYDREAGEPTVVVVDAAGNGRCSGAPGRVDSSYLVEMPASCIDAPPALRWDVYALRDVDRDDETDHVDIAPEDASGTLEQRPSGEVQRVAGGDRIETALLISQRQFAEPVRSVYLAGADAFADAVAGGGLTDGPILLVPSCGTVPQPVHEEIQRLDPTRVVALGGTAVVCEDVLDQARRLPEDYRPTNPDNEPTPEPTDEPTDEPTEGPLPPLPPLPTPSPEPSPEPTSDPEPARRPGTRLAGPDRIATAIAISRDAFREPHRGLVLLARADVFADAVAAGIADRPVLLVPSCDLPQTVHQEIERLEPTTIVILGGAGAICEDVAVEAAQHTTVERIAGEDRYATGAAIAMRWGSGAETVYLANGETFADAVVVAGVLTDGPVLLGYPGCDPVPISARRYLLNHSGAVVALGGTAAVCQATLEDLGAARSP